MKNLDNHSIKNKIILLRADLNVPVVEKKIIEKSRIKMIKRTIKKLQQQKNKIFILSHFGRPQGTIDKKYSLEFICPTLEKEFELDKIFFINNLDNNQIKNVIKKMQPGEICLLENIRFYLEELDNDLNFIKKLCENFDAFVNDAFSVSHRKHASIVGIPNFLPSFAGYGLLEEIRNINSFIDNKQKPNLAIIGGSKTSTKINLLFNLIKFCDFIFIGGAMANTFLYAQNIAIGKSLVEKDLSEIALSILQKSQNLNCKIILPIDVICSDNLDDKSNIRECDVNNIYSNQMILDIGSKTVEKLSQHILQSNMILWNGPLGAFEKKPFEKSSVKVANIIKKKNKSSYTISIAGGGDTLSVIKNAKAEDGFSYISKAGGAFLEWLEGKESPGVLALKKNK
tara:strand:- start:209 stop:1402 length:1194 start_codon:yes stop_codon:yes gene_type:complete